MVRNSAEGMPITSDRAANKGNPRIQFLLALFRIASRARRPLDRRPRLLAVPVGVLYRFVGEWCLGIELPWKTRVGPRLTIFHGYGLVVNDGAVIGAGVTLRNGVTVGNLTPGGPCPVIEDDVDVGAGATILGGVRIGRDARIGAGAVVLRDVPAGATAVGVPARVVASESLET